MATEVITRVLCDICNRDEIKRDGTRFIIAINGKPHEFDACEEHAAPIADTIKILDEFGRKPSGLAPAAPAARYGVNDPQTCAVCGGVFKNRGSLGAHHNLAHGMNAALYRAAAQRADAPPKSAALICPECGKTFAAVPGLASHRKWHERQRGAAQ